MNKKLTSLSLAGVMLLSTASPVFAAAENAMKETKEPTKMEQLVKDGKEKMTEAKEKAEEKMTEAKEKVAPKLEEVKLTKNLVSRLMLRLKKRKKLKLLTLRLLLKRLNLTEKTLLSMDTTLMVTTTSNLET